MNENIIETVEHEDLCGEKWRIELLKDSILLYAPDIEGPVFKVGVNTFELFYDLRGLLRTMSTDDIFEFIEYTIPAPVEPDAGTIFYN